MSVAAKTPRIEKIQIKIGSKKSRLFMIDSAKVNALMLIIDGLREAEEGIPAHEVLPELADDKQRPAAALRGLRFRDDLTQAKVAAALDCPQSWISEMENSVRPIGKKFAQRLAKAFGVDYRVFL